MTHAEEIAKQLVGAVRHVMNGKGPASVRLVGKDGPESGVVVFVMPGPLGIIIDDALDRLYAHLGWRVSKEETGEAK